MQTWYRRANAAALDIQRAKTFAAAPRASQALTSLARHETASHLNTVAGSGAKLLALSQKMKGSSGLLRGSQKLSGVSRACRVLIVAGAATGIWNAYLAEKRVGTGTRRAIVDGIIDIASAVNPEPVTATFLPGLIKPYVHAKLGQLEKRLTL